MGAGAACGGGGCGGGGPVEILLATENLLENTDGVGAPHRCSLGAAACYLLFMLTCAVLVPSLFHRCGGGGCGGGGCGG